MKATVVVDNIANEGLTSEWGLCVYIEYNDQKILLDTGGSNLFVENAAKLGINLQSVDFAVLSHAHWDHANGMPAFFDINKTAKFYIRDACCENCYHKEPDGNFKYIGMPENVLKYYNDRIIYAHGDYRICQGVSLIPHKREHTECIGLREAMYQKIGEDFTPDNFSHEQSLVFETESGLVIFNSCSHGGVDQIMEDVEDAFPGQKVRALIGGLHLFNKTEDEVRKLADLIRSLGIQYICTGHCTGDAAYLILSEELGDIMHQFKSGMVMEF